MLLYELYATSFLENEMYGYVCILVSFADMEMFSV